MSIDRRKRSIKELLQRFIADCQKEKTHRDGLSRLDEKMEGADFSNKLKQVDFLFHFFSCTVCLPLASSQTKVTYEGLFNLYLRTLSNWLLQHQLMKSTIPQGIS